MKNLILPVLLLHALVILTHASTEPEMIKAFQRHLQESGEQILNIQRSIDGIQFYSEMGKAADDANCQFYIYQTKQANGQASWFLLYYFKQEPNLLFIRSEKFLTIITGSKNTAGQIDLFFTNKNSRSFALAKGRHTIHAIPIKALGNEKIRFIYNGSLGSIQLRQKMIWQ